MNGGKMIQDVTDHTMSHAIKLYDNRTIYVTSTHHQMIFPYVLDNSEYEILGWSERHLSKKYLDGDNKDYKTTNRLPDDFVEPEIIYFPKTKCLGIQSHPESMNQSSRDLQTIQEIFTNFYNNKFSTMKKNIMI